MVAMVGLAVAAAAIGAAVVIVAGLRRRKWAARAEIGGQESAPLGRRPKEGPLAAVGSLGNEFRARASGERDASAGGDYREAASEVEVAGAGAWEIEVPARGAARGVPRKVARFVVVDGPEAVTAGNIFGITAELLRNPPADILDAVPVDVAPSVDTEGRRIGDPVTITIYPSSAFEALSAQKAEIDVIPNADPEPAVFQLRSEPSVRGPQEINVVLSQGWLTLGQVKLIVTVRDRLQAPARRIRRSLVVPALWPGNAPVPDVVIQVNRVRCNGIDTLHYTYDWPARGWHNVDAGSVELDGTVGQLIREKLELLDQAARRQVSPSSASSASVPQENELIREYEKVGENLYWDLCTPELHEFYLLFASSAKTLLIFSNDPWIPWELVKPWGDNIDVDNSDFLCAKFDMSRWYYSPECQIPDGLLDVREVAPVLPPSNLPAIRLEEAYFKKLPGSWPHVALSNPLPELLSQVREILTSGQAQVLHFAAHGMLPPGGAGIASIEFADGVLKADELVGTNVANGLRAATPLVFMNACHSGRQVIGLTRPDGWVERCLMMGCRGFLGANWEVNDDLAARFAVKVYAGLVAGSTIARAVRDARWLIRGIDSSNPTWLAYSLYAHPNMKLRPGR